LFAYESEKNDHTQKLGIWKCGNSAGLKTFINWLTCTCT